MSTCRECGNEFTPHSRSRGHQIYCDSNCNHRAYDRRQRAKTSQRECRRCASLFTATHGLQRYCTLECKKAQASERVPPRWRHISSRYGLKPADIEAMLAAQNNRCAICPTELNGSVNDADAPNIDHCHNSGQVRAILCRPCNIALGHLRDDPTIVASALDYLLRWRAAAEAA